MSVRQRVVALERRKHKAGERCRVCGGHGVPVVTYDEVPDRPPCAGCGKSYVLLGFVGWGKRRETGSD